MLQAEDADAVCAAAFAFGFLNVDPAVVVSLVEKLFVVLAKWSESFFYDLESLLVIQLTLSRRFW